MADFCSKCEEKYFDINLTEMALEVKRGYSFNFLCEGCDRCCVYKDEEGRLYIGHEVDGEIDLREVSIEEL